jgi:hypothetical protein
MPLPVTFAQLPEGDNPASLLDNQFAAVAALTVIPCQCTGTNQLALTVFLDGPTVPAYTDLSPVFAFMTPNTNTGNVTINVESLGEYPAFKNNGNDLIENGDLIAGCAYQCFYLSFLNSGGGGFVVNVYPLPAPTTPGRIGDDEMPNFVLYSGPGTFTYRPPHGLMSAIIEGMGGGGGGGPASGGNPDALAGGGGGSGGYFRAVLTTSQIGTEQQLTVGAGGAEQANGGNTNFGTLCTATGGGAGAGNDAVGSANGAPGTPGIASLAAGVMGLAMIGNGGFWGTLQAPAAGFAYAGSGGAVFGGAGLGWAASGGVVVNGNPGAWGGGGAGGAVESTSTPAQVAQGGAGGSGWILITEYIRIDRHHDRDHDHDRDRDRHPHRRFDDD